MQKRCGNFAESDHKSPNLYAGWGACNQEESYSGQATNIVKCLTVSHLCPVNVNQSETSFLKVA